VKTSHSLKTGAVRGCHLSAHNVLLLLLLLPTLVVDAGCLTALLQRQ
jgi:hypothetical protein